MEFTRLKSDGTAAGTGLEAEARAVPGEELWWPPGGSAGVIVTEQTALQMAALLATVGTIATDTAVLPLCIHQEMDGGKSREAKEHAAYELVARSPDGEATPVRWRQAWMGHALIYGNGFAEIQRRGNGKPCALHLLDPSCTRSARARSGALYYETGGGATIPAANVLHIAGLGFDGVSGYNMVRLLRQAIGLGIAGESFAADYFANGSESGGTIEVPGRLKDKAASDRLRDGWEGRHQGAGRRHRIAVLEEGAKYSPTSTDPEKSQLLETRKFQVLDTIRAWRLPPHKAGDYSHSHLANIESANLDYLMTSLMGWLVVIEQECDLKLFTRAEWLAGYRFKHEVTALLRGDLKSRYDSYSTALRDGWLSRNEVRLKESLDPIPPDQGGDLYTVQMQVVPLGSEPATDTPPPPNAAAEPMNGDRSLRFNPNHGKDGRFGSGSGKGGGGGGGSRRPEPSKVRGDEHAGLLAEQKGERKAEAADIRGERAALLDDQAKATRDHARDQADETRDLVKEHAADAKEQSRDQAKEVKEQGRDQAKEVKEFDRDAAKADKEHLEWVADGSHDRNDLDSFRQGVAADRAELLGQHTADRHELARQHTADRADLAELQAADLAEHHERQAETHREFLADLAAERKDVRQTHRERIGELTAAHRQMQADLLRELHEDKHP